jgi:hypothetical protein
MNISCQKSFKKQGKGLCFCLKKWEDSIVDSWMHGRLQCKRVKREEQGFVFML